MGREFQPPVVAEEGTVTTETVGQDGQSDCSGIATGLSPNCPISVRNGFPHQTFICQPILITPAGKAYPGIFPRLILELSNLLRRTR